MARVRSVSRAIVLALLFLQWSGPTMAWAGSISGGVRERNTNTPISGATVRLEQNGQIKFTTTTNTSGVYSFTGIPNGPYNLVALKACYQNAGPFPRDLGNLTNQNIIMDWYPRLSGGVRDNLTNNPISGATVRLEQNGQIVYTTTTNGSGVYSFSCIVAGNYNLVALKLGEYVNWSQSIQLSINIASSQNIAMTPCATIAGGVRDAVTNEALTGATVRLEQDGQIKYVFQYTGTDGVYSIAGVVPGDYNLVGLKLGDYFNWSQPRTLAAGEHVNGANIAMDPTFARVAGGVRIHNVTPTVPISGATVRLEQNQQIKFVTTTNATGNYSFDKVPPGDYNLVALKLGQYVNWSHPKQYAAGDNLTEENIAMDPVTTLSGHVLASADQSPIAGAQVELHQGSTVVASTTTAADGFYSLGELDCGTYSLVVSANLFVSSSAPFTTTCFSANSVDILLQRQRNPLTVTVRSREAPNPPIAGAVVGWGSFSGLTGADGKCVMGSVDCGPGTLTVQASGFGSDFSIRTVSCSGSTGFMVDLTPGAGGLSGVITADEPGTPPIEGATVEYGDEQATTGPDGSYSLSGVSCGSHVLRISAEGFIGIETSLATTCGTVSATTTSAATSAATTAATTGYNRSLSRASASLSGHVYSTAPSHQGIPGAVVQMGPLSTVTDGNGNYSFSAVSCGLSGSAWLTVTRTGFHSERRVYRPSCTLANREDVAMAPIATPKPEWVVLIPGLCEGPQMWDETTYDGLNSNGISFAAWLQDQGYRVRKVSLSLNEDSRSRDNPSKLVARLKEQLPNDGLPVHLVGYSMGGLVARDFVRLNPRDLHGVRTLITLSTPHHGSDGAVWLQWARRPDRWLLLGALQQTVLAWLGCQADSRALTDLFPGSQYLNELNYGSKNATQDKNKKSWDAHQPELLNTNVRFHAIVGTGGLCHADKSVVSAWIKAPLWVRTDGVVSEQAQRLWDVRTSYAIDTDIGSPEASHSLPYLKHRLPLPCLQPWLPSIPVVWQHVIDYIANAGSRPAAIAHVSTSSDVITEESTEASVEVPTPSGTIQPGDPILVPIQVPVASNLSVHLGGAGVALDLKDPSGNWITPTSPGVTYEEDSLGVLHTYQIPTPMAGQWTLRFSLPQEQQAQEYVAVGSPGTELEFAL